MNTIIISILCGIVFILIISLLIYYHYPLYRCDVALRINAELFSLCRQGKLDFNLYKKWDITAFVDNPKLWKLKTTEDVVNYLKIVSAFTNLKVYKTD